MTILDKCLVSIGSLKKKRHLLTKTLRRVATCKSILCKFLKVFYSYVSNQIELQNYASKNTELLKWCIEVFCRDKKL